MFIWMHVKKTIGLIRIAYVYSTRYLMGHFYKVHLKNGAIITYYFTTFLVLKDTVTIIYILHKYLTKCFNIFDGHTKV
jgi:hypothetical protein